MGMGRKGMGRTVKAYQSRSKSYQPKDKRSSGKDVT